jgi:general secretion pathway protein G
MLPWTQSVAVILLAVLLACGCDRQKKGSAVAQAQLAKINVGIAAYRIDFNKLPADLPSLTRPAMSRTGREFGPYLTQEPIDPWGRPYVYHRPPGDGASATVFSAGPDGQEGTEDDVHPATIEPTLKGGGPLAQSWPQPQSGVTLPPSEPPMNRVLHILLAASALAIFLWMLLGSKKPDDENSEIDPTDDRHIGTLIGLTGGTIQDAAIARFALQRFEQEHSRKATVQEMAIVAGVLKGMKGK